MMGRELWLRDALATVADDYDVILLDCPGNLGLVVVNALVAAREVIVCVKPGWKELRALTRIEQTIARVQNTFAANGANPELVGVLMVDTPTSRQSGAVYDDAKTEAEAAYQEKFLPTIRRSTKVPEAYSHQKALPFFDRSAEVTTEYAAVVKALGFHAAELIAAQSREYRVKRDPATLPVLQRTCASAGVLWDSHAPGFWVGGSLSVTSESRFWVGGTPISSRHREPQP